MKEKLGYILKQIVFDTRTKEKRVIFKGADMWGYDYIEEATPFGSVEEVTEYIEDFVTESWFKCYERIDKFTLKCENIIVSFKIIEMINY